MENVLHYKNKICHSVKDSNYSLSFTKYYTQYIKGIAVLFLLSHHLFWRKVELPMDYSTATLYDYITVLTKVCVALFTILSGFGMARSWSRYKQKNGDKLADSFKFSFLHIKKLLINYWWVYVPAFILSFLFHIEGTPIDIYGRNIKGVVYFLLDFTGMRALIYSPTLNNTWWYMELIIVCYLLFPMFVKVIESHSYEWLILAIVTGAIALLGTKEITGIEVNTDREVFYFFPFVLGIIIEKRRILDKWIDICSRKKNKFIFFVLGSFVCFTLLRTKISLISDVVYALSLIALGIVMKEYKICRKLLEFLGTHSMNIFLIHSFIYCYFGITSSVISILNGSLLKYIALVMLSLLGSVIVELLKRKSRKFIEKAIVVKR